MTNELFTESERQNSILNETIGTIFLENDPFADLNYNDFAEFLRMEEAGKFRGEQLARDGVVDNDIAGWVGRFIGGAVGAGASSLLGVDTGNEFGLQQVQRFRQEIEEFSLLHGVDPDLVATIMYLENSHGWYDQLLPDSVPSSILPMNINPDLWGGLLSGQVDAHDPATNIELGVILIGRIAERVDNPTVENIASLYNNLATDNTTDFGARAGDIYRNALFGTSFSGGVATEANRVIRDPNTGRITTLIIPDATTGGRTEYVQPVSTSWVRQDTYDGTGALTSSRLVSAIDVPGLGGVDAPTSGDSGTFLIDSFAWDSQSLSFWLGVDEAALIDANPSLDLNNLNNGDIVILPGADNALLDIGTNTSLDFTLDNPFDTDLLAQDVLNGFLSNNGTDWISAPSNLVDLNGIFNTTLSGIASDDFRPGDVNISDSGTIFGSDGTFSNWYEVWNTDGPVDPLGLGSEFNYFQTEGEDTLFIDPLILDMDGDGVRLVSYAASGVLFDIDNDEHFEQTGWSSAEDGFLVHDLNSNGVIDDGGELFSQFYAAGITPGSYADGFQALAELDSNSDGLFDASDAAFNSVRVWIDADTDGRTDAGELRTLAALGIESVNLNATHESGAVREGNEVLASGTFTINPGSGAVTREAIAANFLANPDGNTISASGTGTVVTSESGASSYVVGDIAGETVDVTQKGVDSAYGAAGDDTLIGSAGSNWLGGGAGSDTFDAGDGNDVLLIDAEDLQANIDAGEGIDIAHVIGDRGVTLNLAQANLEVAEGGRGNDVLLSGGNKNTFIRAGDGNDIVIGGGANDALSGEAGDDIVDGGAGNDVVRGHEGKDRLIGGVGNDIVEGGLGDDLLFGGTGDDVLEGGQGDDRIEGGDGEDLARYSGSYRDYRITRADGGIFIADTVSGRDGTDFLTDIERLSFRDVSTVELSLDSPMASRDVIDVPFATGASAPHLIASTDLLANDIDYQGDVLHITAVVGADGVEANAGASPIQAVGGTVQLTAAGDVLFTPDPNHTGVMGFQYKIADEDGTPGVVVTIPGTTQQAEMKAAVYLRTADQPTDDLFTDQWYITDTNIMPVWGDFTGKGVSIGVFEPGSQFSPNPQVFDYRHPDLAGNADRAWLASGEVETEFSNHATMVAGVIGASRNGEGTVGVAYDASLAGVSFVADTASWTPPDLGPESWVWKQKEYDITNNSWGFFEESGWFWKFTGSPDPFEQAAAIGRDYLGTVMVFAAGNERSTGGDTNYSNLTNMRWGVTVGGISAKADLGALVTNTTSFSSPGASILISAPASNIDSTSRLIQNSHGSTFGDDYSSTVGTSFAAPIVSGVVALMLEANPYLGYRDVQEILALTARRVDDPDTNWAHNGATNWNGGGMHVSHDYGFGNVDALAAVRLAESWRAAKTFLTEQGLSVANTVAGQIPDGASFLERTFDVTSSFDIEHVELTINVNHAHRGDLIIELYSPSGTKSILMDRAGKAPGSDVSDTGIGLGGNFPWTFGSVHHWGEDAQGTWRVRIYDAVAGNTGAVTDLSLGFYGKGDDNDDVYVFTNEFGAVYPGAQRSNVTDIDAGVDIVNAAAVSGNSTINLNNGTTSTIAGKSVIFSGDIEIAIGGDGDDVVTGNALFNDLVGGRGDDIISAGAGADFLEGGPGVNTLSGGASSDFFVVRRNANAADTITDFSLSEFPDHIILSGFHDIADFTDLSLQAVGADTHINLGGGQSVILQGLMPSQLSEQNFIFITDTGLNSPWLNLEVFKVLIAERATAFGNPADEFLTFPATGAGAVNYFALGGGDGILHEAQRTVLSGGNGDDTIYADHILDAQGSPVPNAVSGIDWIEGGSGEDHIYAGGSADIVHGGSGDDLIYGEEGDDYLRGDSGNDLIWGGDGNDILIGGRGASDFLHGGADDDTLVLDGDLSSVDSLGTLYLGARYGGTGGDTFYLSASGLVTGTLFDGGTYVNGINLIGDFDAAADRIDLSGVSWVKGFADLTISSQTLSGVLISTVSATNGSESFDLNLAGISASQLSNSHFVFGQQDGYLAGGNGNDNLVGDAGGNILDGGAGADAMEGRTGDDIYFVDNLGDNVIELAGGGFDTVKSSVSFTLGPAIENLTLTGTASIDGIGNALSNRIVGNSGANRLDGGAGGDTLVGGAGDDTYIVDNGSDAILEREAEGNDAVLSAVSYTLGRHIEDLTLTGTDSVNATGNELANVITGNSGDNILDGGSGADDLIGGAGHDTYIIDELGDSVTELSNEGYDAVYTGVDLTLGANLEGLMMTGTDALSGIGNALDNVMIGNGANNSLSGLDGNDFIDGRGGADLMIGGLGDDTYVVDSLGDVINEVANGGNDTVQSSITYSLASDVNLENLLLSGTAAIDGTGNASNNLIQGNSAQNILTGAGGNDVLDGGAGADTMNGGLGDDTYLVDDVADIVVENAGAGLDTVESRVDYTLGSNLENLVLTGVLDLTGTGNDLENELIGNLGDNVLVGGAGADTLRGGLGDDVYYIDDANDFVDEKAGEGIDTVYSAYSFPGSEPLFANVENIILTGGYSQVWNGWYWESYRPRAIGNALDNQITGTSYADVISGGDGDDLIIGTDGDDVIHGGAGADTYRFTAGLEGEQNLSTGIGDRLEFIGIDPAAVTLQRGEWDFYYDDSPEEPDHWVSGNGLGLAMIYTDMGGTGKRLLVGDGRFFSSDGVDNKGLAGIFFDADQDGNFETAWTHDQIKTRLSAVSSGDDTVYLFSDNDVVDGGLGDDRIFGGGGSDIIHGGDGDDVISVGGYQFPGSNIQESWFYGDAGNDTLTGSYAVDHLYGGTGDDVISGDIPYYYNAGNDDELFGGDGNDILNGIAGNDLLDGGAGDDQLHGGAGDDTYLYNGGNDTIDDGAYQGGGNDTVRLEGYKLSELTFSRTVGYIYSNAVGNDLRVRVAATGEELLIKNYFLEGAGGDPYRIENIEVLAEDGSGYVTVDTNTMTDMLRQPTEGDDVIELGADGDFVNAGGGNDKVFAGDGMDVVVGADGIDHLNGEGGNDLLLGLNDNDYLYGGAGDDNLLGGDGDDILWGDQNTWPIVEGNDILDGGFGNDTLYGGYGDDTYVLRAGNGQDTAQDVGGANDTLRITFDPIDLVFKQIGQNLVAQVAGSSDQITFSNWFLNDAYLLENYESIATGVSMLGQRLEQYMDVMNRFAASHGTTWEQAVVSHAAEARVIVDDFWKADPAQGSVIGTDGDEVLNGTAAGEFLYGDAGVDTLNGLAGDDWLDGGSGADTLVGGLGNDTYVVDDLLDIVQEAAGEGIDTVRASGSYTLADNVENLALFGVFYDSQNTTATGNALDNVLTAGSGHTRLRGEGGNDTLRPGSGTDYLTGGTGADVFLVDAGGLGQNRVLDADAGDIIRFEGFTATDIQVTRGRWDYDHDDDDDPGYFEARDDGSSIEFRVSNSDGVSTVMVEGYANQNGTDDIRIGRVEFDGGFWTFDDVAPQFLVTTGGNDVVYGFGSDDILDGGAGDDRLFGRSGDDILNGGEGTDRLWGDLGSDTFVFNVGTGADTVFDYDHTGTDTDRVTTDYDPIDLALERVNNNLLISALDTSDSLEIERWYSSSAYQVERFEAADGSVLLDTRVDDLIHAMAGFVTDNGAVDWQDAVQHKPDEALALVSSYWSS